MRRRSATRGPKLTCKPFTLYNAGLYDFSKLRELPWESWRFFALQLFQCRDEPHKIGGVQLDGYLKGASVLVFNHLKNPAARFTEETLDELHEALGSRVGNGCSSSRPRLTFDFQQDYINRDKVRYYAMRIPYSIIHELHQREFRPSSSRPTRWRSTTPSRRSGFDFIRTPEMKFDCGRGKRKGELIEEGFIRLTKFKSEAVVREPLRKKANLETLSMVMLDYDFDEESRCSTSTRCSTPTPCRRRTGRCGSRSMPWASKMMAVFIDIYGNESRVLLTASSSAGRPTATERPLPNQGQPKRADGKNRRGKDRP